MDLQINEQYSTTLKFDSSIQNIDATEFPFEHSTLPTNPQITSREKKYGLHAKKRFGKVYKSDEVAHLYESQFDPTVGHSRQFNAAVSADTRWSSSSSSAHCSMSDRSSIDFGVENKYDSLLEDFGDATRENKKRYSGKPKAFETGENLRTSIGSFSSCETADDAFFQMLNDEYYSSNVTAIGMSSSDESDIDKNISRSRISAATVYESEALKELEYSKKPKNARETNKNMSSNVDQTLSKEKLTAATSQPSATIYYESKSDKTSSSSPFILKLERQLSMESSVSTLSDTDTVIHISGSNSPKLKTLESSAKKENQNKQLQSSKSRTTVGEAMLESDSLKSRVDKYTMDYSISDKSNALRKSPRNVYARTKKRNRSSESSESTEEQEIFLDISDGTLSDSLGHISDSKKAKDILRKEMRGTSSSESLRSSNRDECFVIGNRYAMVYDRKKSAERGRKKPEQFMKHHEKFEPNEKMVESSLFGPDTDLTELPSPELSSAAAAVRFSTSSFCTDLSDGEPLIFSETEGEEIPCEDTSDEDLRLEDQVLKAFAEVRNYFKLTNKVCFNQYK